MIEIENLIKHEKNEIKLLKKRFLDESNRQCLATDYWKDQFDRFYKNAGFFEQKDKKRYHDPHGLMFAR